MRKDSSAQLTTADLVVLSLLMEAPMHGYEVNAELQRREVSDWAGISKPQIYYSLKKLASLKFIKAVSDAEGSLGPEKQTFTSTERGIAAFSKSLEREEWATQRPPPPFLTWLVLSIHSEPKVTRKMFDKRKSFLRSQVEKETKTLAEIRVDSGPTIPIAELIVELAIKQFELELLWIEQVKKRLRV